MSVCAWHLLRVGLAAQKGVELSRGLSALLVVKSVADLELADSSQACPHAREVQDQVRRLLPLFSHFVAVKLHCGLQVRSPLLATTSSLV